MPNAFISQSSELGYICVYELSESGSLHNSAYIPMSDVQRVLVKFPENQKNHFLNRTIREHINAPKWAFIYYHQYSSRHTQLTYLMLTDFSACHSFGSHLIRVESPAKFKLC